MQVVVLGAGLVGKAIALDLATAHTVTSADIREQALGDLARRGLSVKHIDFRDKKELHSLLGSCDVVVSAVPGFLGFQVLRDVIDAGKSVVDISFFPEDPFRLDALAADRGVTAVVDCGVAPGMGNILLGYHNKRMQVRAYTCYVGGLPAKPEWPYAYKAVFSPIDVIEEYTRSARFVRSGKLVTMEALTDPEIIAFPGVGPLEAWNSDGLRTLLGTMPHIPDMIEKTLRYPGSMEAIKVLRHTGFFSKEKVEVDGHVVTPLAVTAKLLFPKWDLQPGEEEFTAMEVRIEGKEQNKDVSYVYRLFDRTDTKTGTLSMARATGYTCAAAVHLILRKMFRRQGICAPEFLGEEEANFEFIMGYLAARGVNYRRDNS